MMNAVRFTAHFKSHQVDVQTGDGYASAENMIV